MGSDRDGRKAVQGRRTGRERGWEGGVGYRLYNPFLASLLPCDEQRTKANTKLGDWETEDRHSAAKKNRIITLAIAQYKVSIHKVEP
ncbi:hypothetical protein EJB05_30522, partial [Eragrostis curvula]